MNLDGFILHFLSFVLKLNFAKLFFAVKLSMFFSLRKNLPYLEPLLWVAPYYWPRFGRSFAQQTISSILSLTNFLYNRITSGGENVAYIVSERNWLHALRSFLMKSFHQRCDYMWSTVKAFDVTSHRCKLQLFIFAEHQLDAGSFIHASIDWTIPDKGSLVIWGKIIFPSPFSPSLKRPLLFYLFAIISTLPSSLQ